MQPRKKIGAFFDFDGTLYEGVIAFDFLNFAIRHRMLGIKQMTRLPKFLYYYALDKFKLADRYDVNMKIYKKIKGWSTRVLNQKLLELFKNKIGRKLIPESISILNNHKKQGHTVIIVTSALKEIINMLTDRINPDDIIATEVEINDGKYNGIIKLLPVGKHRIKIIKEYANYHDIDLANSYGYSDHYSDIPMLKCVGNPVATNPERKLRRYAKRHGWKIIDT